MSNILILDDEPDILELLSLTIKRMQLKPVSAQTIGDAKDILAKQDIQLCLTDMRLPDGSGLDFITHIQQNHSHIPVAMITAYGSIDMALDAMKAGAFDFLSKPVELEKLRSIIKDALKLNIQVEQETP